MVYDAEETKRYELVSEAIGLMSDWADNVDCYEGAPVFQLLDIQGDQTMCEAAWVS